MASMTDIIFLLLIFFMITSSAISQSAIDVNLPKAAAQDPSVTDPTTVTINADGKYFVNDLETPKEQLEQNIVKWIKYSKFIYVILLFDNLIYSSHINSLFLEKITFFVYIFLF